jgi:hypothetical protein
MAQEMDVPLSSRTRRRSQGALTNDPRTLQSYVEFLAVNCFALIVYFWKPDSGNGDLPKGKKIYLGDPLLHTITADRTGLIRDVHADVENAVALALYRRYEPAERSPENTTAPERLHVWAPGAAARSISSAAPAIRSLPSTSQTGTDSTARRRQHQCAHCPTGRRSSRPATSWSSAPTAKLVPAAMLPWALSA